MLSANRFEVAAEVRRIVSETLAISAHEISESTLIIEELRATSLDVVILAMTLGDFFGVEFNLAEIPSTRVSVSWVIEYICFQTRGSRRR